MHKFKKFKLLATFIGLLIVGIIIRYIAGKNSSLWDFWITALVVAVLAFFAYKEMVKDEDKIALYFKIDTITTLHKKYQQIIKLG